jgi:hypothetical protein
VLPVTQQGSKSYPWDLNPQHIVYKTIVLPIELEQQKKQAGFSPASLVLSICLIAECKADASDFCFYCYRQRKRQATFRIADRTGLLH